MTENGYGIAFQAGLNQTVRGVRARGAVAATMAFAPAAGARRGLLLDYTTSHDEMPRGEPTDFVGYAGVAFSTSDS